MDNNNDYVLRSDVLEIAMEWCPDDDGSVGKVGDLREMLDEIESIPAADVEPKRKWIPVTERLPEVEEGFTDCESFAEDKDGEYYPIGVYTCWESEPVLIFACIDGMKERHTARYEEWRFADGRPKECGWIDVSGDVELSFVTHWMPLPEPPKEGDDGEL